MATILLIGVILYIATAVAFAAYLLNSAFLHGVGEFEKAAIGALIAVIGTGLTALAAVYTANRQAAAAREVELLKVETGGQLATLSSKLSADLETLKAHLDAAKIAHRELCGAASVYFYALRSAALGSYDDKRIEQAETGMVEAARHLIYVSEEVRDQWLTFWQEAQYIYRTALAEPDQGRRPEILQNLMLEQVQEGRSSLDFRKLHARVEETARRAIQEELGTAAHSTRVAS